MKTLTEAISTNTVHIRQGKEYNWERVYDAETIRAHHNAHVKIGNVLISGEIPKAIAHYAESLNETIEAWEYDNKSILLCASCDEFGGTFQSHANIETNFFLLTPKVAKSQK